MAGPPQSGPSGPQGSQSGGTGPLRVAVIGAGTAGVVACRFIVEAGHVPVVLDQQTQPGGNWARRGVANDVVYKGLVTNLPTVIMRSGDLDFPKNLPSYVKPGDIGD